jgi:uncharacterized protein YjbJ (UPF0337 family)
MAEHDKTGPEAGVSSAAEGVKGKVKEAVGTVMGNDRVADEGRAQQDKADAERDVARKEAEAERARSEADVAQARERANQDR